MEKREIIPLTEEEIRIANAYLESHSILEVLTAYLPEISTHFRNFYAGKLERLNSDLDITYGENSKEKLVKSALKEESELLKTEHVRNLLWMYDLTYSQLKEQASSFQAFQKSGFRLTDKDLTLEIEMPDALKTVLIAYVNGENSELSEEAHKINLLKLIEFFPEGFKEVFNDPENIRPRFISYLIDLYFKRLYVKGLVNWLEEDEETDLPEDVLVIKKPKIGIRSKESPLTKLSRDQTVSLTLYLMKTGVFFDEGTGYQTKANIAKAIQILTGYEHENIRQKLSMPEQNKNDLKLVRNKLEEIILLISKDLGPK